jgi:competence protein ComEC
MNPLKKGWNQLANRPPIFSLDRILGHACGLFVGMTFLVKTISHIARLATQNLAKTLTLEADRWVLWVPVALAVGIVIYVALPFQPQTFTALAAASLGFFLCALGLVHLGWGALRPLFQKASTTPIFLAESLKDRPIVRLSLWAGLWISLGFGIMTVRVDRLDPGMLVRPLPALWLQGKVLSIDHPSSRTKLFQRVVLRLDDHRSGQWGTALPKKAQITIRTPCNSLQEGDILRMRAKLEPLPTARFPGAHDPRWVGFFQGIGARGFALSPPRLIASGSSPLLAQTRHSLTRTFHRYLPVPLGSVACGLVTGDKVALPNDVRQWFSDSGLAHLLAIAGLHVSMVAGFCFALCHRCLSWIPGLANRWPLDRVSALVALSVGGFYLRLSGQRTPALRAFFMLAGTMIAMLAMRNRHAMRTLMLCATLFLFLRPESVFDLSYQLSFAAVAGLLSFYELRMQRRLKNLVSDRISPVMKRSLAGDLARPHPHPHPNLPKMSRLRQLKGIALRPFSALFQSLPRSFDRQIKRYFRHLGRQTSHSLLSTLALTLATGPITAFHFGHISIQGLLANLVAVPFTASIVMPLGMVTLLSLSLPWAQSLLNLWAMTLSGLVWMAKISATGLSALLVAVPSPDPSLFALELGGLLWAVLWNERWRMWGLVVGCGAFAFGLCSRPKPDLLIDIPHKMWAQADWSNGVLTPSTSRRGKITLTRWAESLGLTPARPCASHRPKTTNASASPSFDGKSPDKPSDFLTSLTGKLARLGYPVPKTLIDDLARPDLSYSVLVLYPPRHPKGSAHVVSTHSLRPWHGKMGTDKTRSGLSEAPEGANLKKSHPVFFGL